MSDEFEIWLEQVRSVLRSRWGLFVEDWPAADLRREFDAGVDAAIVARSIQHINLLADYGIENHPFAQRESKD